MIDGDSAIEIKNFKSFVEVCNNSKNLITDKKMSELSIEEIKYRNYSKKQILYKKNLTKGKILKKKDLIFLRTSKKGEIVDDINFFINKKLKKPVLKMSNLKKSDFI